MASIPLDVILKIESQRPDLVPLIHDLMATNDSALEGRLEQRLARAYLDGFVSPASSVPASADLTAEEIHYLSACRAGQKYADVDKSSLH